MPLVGLMRQAWEEALDRRLAHNDSEGLNKKLLNKGSLPDLAQSYKVACQELGKRATLRSSPALLLASETTLLDVLLDSGAFLAPEILVDRLACCEH